MHTKSHPTATQASNRGVAPASPHQTNQSACKPELHSWELRGGRGGRSLSTSVLSQIASKRSGLEVSEGMENALRTRRRGGEACTAQAGQAACPHSNRSLSARSRGGESCSTLLLFLEVLWTKMAVVMQAMSEPPPRIAGSARLPIENSVNEACGRLFWNHAQ